MGEQVAFGKIRGIVMFAADMTSPPSPENPWYIGASDDVDIAIDVGIIFDAAASAGAGHKVYRRADGGGDTWGVRGEGTPIRMTEPTDYTSYGWHGHLMALLRCAGIDVDVLPQFEP